MRPPYLLFGLLALFPASQIAASPDQNSESKSSSKEAAAVDAQSVDDKPSWDIDGAQGGTIKPVSFSTKEGTWMNLDVSPDGSQLVFDLLGDIYTLPIEGGKATRLRGSRSMDVQPRYSPDGSRIVFVSDKAGGDNLWTMAADGSDLQQVTDEDFRLLNNPDWSPDGDWLVARKHFTSERSLGAGELWQFHRSGGKGMQLTERKNDQQDAGQPVYSPDGKYIYFSEDMSGGTTFRYNKDANEEIYRIRRLHRDSGVIDELITGPGGAIAPTPSPDGKTIAFVRRQRDKSVLFLFDTDSGRQYPVYNNLSHDQQEAWAIFGPYPNMSWTPAGDALVFWAQGKIHRFDLASQEVSEIPFEVTVDTTVVSAVTHDYDLTADTFPSKMLSDAATSPDGKWLVFHSAGYLWKKQLPNGEPERITKGGDFEYEPAFSPDGKSLTYVTWSDRELGAVHTISLNGRNNKTLTNAPGYYREPRFSPDGQRIVYRKGQGSAALGYVYGMEPGLYWIPAKGGEAQFITRDGREPFFEADGDGVVFLTGADLEKHLVRSDLSGANTRTLMNLKYINHLAPSPDSQWIAFNELHQGYVMPLPKIGLPMTLDKDSEALPIRKLTVDVGTDLHWSGNQQLHWLVGDSYFTQNLDDAFAFLGDKDLEPTKPENLVGIPVGLNYTADKPQQHLALTNVRILTMNANRDVIESGTVLIRNNQIEAVGANIDIPEDAERVDAAGKTIVPGYVDVHAHAGHFHEGPVPQSYWPYYANLAYGITTIHDPSANTEFVFTQSEMVRNGTLVGPRVLSTGTILYGADGDFKAVVNSLDDARSHVRRMKDVGALSVKSYNQPRRDQRQQINEAAREEGLLVVMEGGSTFYHNLSMIFDGSTGIEHNIPLAPLYDDVMQLWQQTDVGLTPTLVVNYGGLSGEYWWYEHDDVFDAEPLVNFVPRPDLDARARRRQKTPEEEYFHIEVAKSVKALADAGVGVQVGGHGQMQGLSPHWEMWSLAQGGMTPMNVLAAATIDGAEYLGLDAELGSVESGKLADLVILNENPLEDIRNTDDTAMVMINGRLYDSLSMNQMFPDKRERPLLWFEREGAAFDSPSAGDGAGYSGVAHEH